MSLRELNDGEFLISENTVDDSLHVLLAGKLEVVKHTAADGSASDSEYRSAFLSP